jgi:cell wall-associated NlpC family hydrolase
MMHIVTDVEGGSARSAPLSQQSSRRIWRPAFAILAVSSLSVLPILATATSSQAATATSLEAQANQLQQEISSTGVQLSALGQRYDQARNELASIDGQIATTRTKIASDQHTVATDQIHLRSAVVDEYLSDGTAGQANPLFSGNQRSYAAAQEYGQVATGNLDVAVANLHTAQVALIAERSNLLTQQGSAQAAVNAAAAAQAAADQQQSALESELGQVKGQLGTLEEEAQAHANGVQGTITRGVLTSSENFPPPPSDGAAGSRAVAAAESQIGVPYVWGGESPGVGFDCSGLVAWAWGQAGVGLPHYSGAQMADSAPVPVSDLEPGDLLFYGPGGSQHVAMYVGGGEMIEAPYTGASVWVTSLRLGDGFVGAGRP